MHALELGAHVLVQADLLKHLAKSREWPLPAGAAPAVAAVMALIAGGVFAGIEIVMTGFQAGRATAMRIFCATFVIFLTVCTPIFTAIMPSQAHIDAVNARYAAACRTGNSLVKSWHNANGPVAMKYVTVINKAASEIDDRCAGR